MVQEQEYYLENPQQSQQQPFQYTAPSLISGTSDDFLKWLSQHKNIIDQIIHRLRGDEYDYLNDRWVNHEERRIANEVGINAIILKIAEKVNQFNIMSNLTDEQVHEITWAVDLVVVPLLVLKYEEYEIDPQYLAYIWDMIDSTVFIGLRRAVGQGERVFLTKTTTRSEVYHENPAQQNKNSGGGFSKLFGLFK